MRSREEIEKQFDQSNEKDRRGAVVELLLDIRELLRDREENQPGDPWEDFRAELLADPKALDAFIARTREIQHTTTKNKILEVIEAIKKEISARPILTTNDHKIRNFTYAAFRDLQTHIHNLEV